MRNEYIGSAVSLILYLLFISGIAFLQADNIRVVIKRFRLRHRLSVKEEKGSLVRSASLLLSGATGKDADGIYLIIGEIILFALTFFISYETFSAAISLALSVLISALPLALLFSRMYSMQSKGSREGISLVTELYRQYRMCNLNIFEAMERSIESSNDFPICRKQMYILLLKLRDASGSGEIKLCCRMFGKALGSVWGHMLSSCIESSAVYGTDISAGLVDITEQLRLAKARDEERKRLNSEAMRMTVILVPLLYAATVLAAIKYLNLPVSKFFRNQFMTPEGLMFFTISILLFFINLIILSVADGRMTDF